MAQQQVTGQVGTIGPVASGSPAVPARQGNYGEIMVSELNGRYYEQSLRGNVFVCAQTAGTALIAAAAGGVTLQLFNPSNSLVNLAILDITVTIEAATAQTAMESVYLCGNSTGATQTLTTPLTAYSSQVGGGRVASGKPLVSSTFTNSANPLRYLGSFAMGATATSGINTLTSFKDDVGGLIIVPPGSFVGIYGLTGGTVGDLTIASSISWVELSSVIL
jgi:hypothetical protein